MLETGVRATILQVSVLPIPGPSFCPPLGTRFPLFEGARRRVQVLVTHFAYSMHKDPPLREPEAYHIPMKI